MKLTGKRLLMLRAVAGEEHANFHKITCEALESLGLIHWIGQWRLVGCNSFSAKDFEVTDAGRQTLSNGGYVL